jgi:predicted O-methyltransferase YrrM
MIDPPPLRVQKFIAPRPCSAYTSSTCGSPFAAETIQTEMSVAQSKLRALRKGLHLDGPYQKFIRPPVKSCQTAYRARAERAYFRHCLETGKPYFGSILRSAQGNEARYRNMLQLAARIGRDHSTRPVNILEIGSWAGGSAVVWGTGLQRYSPGGGKLLCVDSWRAYFQDEEIKAPRAYADMENAMASGEIVFLFNHNIKSSGLDSLVLSARGRSADVLPLLAPGSFDLVYVDGDHAYTAVKQDIENAKRLVSDGGILCGDDLEMELGAVDEAHARASKERDFICDPRTGQWFHPGVTLAVSESIGGVASWDGFWAVQKQGGSWKKFELEPDNSQIELPVQLKPPERADHRAAAKALFRRGHIFRALLLFTAAM